MHEGGGPAGSQKAPLCTSMGFWGGWVGGSGGLRPLSYASLLLCSWGWTDVRVAEDAAAYAQQPNPTDQRPEVQIHIVGTILEALYLAIPRPQGS